MTAPTPALPRSTGRGGRSVVNDRVLDVPQARLHRFVINLVVADRRLQVYVPVHQPLAAVDQSILEELEEGFAHRAGALLIQSKPRAAPVAGTAQPLQL